MNDMARVEGLRRLGRVDTIERLLIWAYRDQRVERGDIGGPAMLGVSGTGKVIEYLQLGCRVDGSGAGARFVGAGDDAASDAILIDRLVARHRRAGLVRLHARAGSRPDWRPAARWRFVPEQREEVPSLDGVALRLPGYEALREYWPSKLHMPSRVSDAVENAARWRAKGHPLNRYVDVVPVQECDSPDSVASAREEYRAWRDALVALRDAMLWAPPLRDWEVAADLPPEDPWLDADLLGAARQAMQYPV